MVEFKECGEDGEKDQGRPGLESGLGEKEECDGAEIDRLTKE